MEDERRAAARFLAFVVAAGAFALLVTVPQLHGGAIVFLLPWVLVVGGPAAVWLLHGPAASSEREWLRVAAPVFVGAAGALALTESALLRQRPLHAEAWSIGLLLPLALLAAAVPAWRRSDAAGRGWMLGALAAFGLAFALRLALAGLAFFALEAAIFLALAGFHRSLRAWATAAFAGLLVLFLGMTFVLALRGSLWPPRVILDTQEFAMLVLPMVLAGAATACGTLLFWRERRGRPA